MFEQFVSGECAKVPVIGGNTKDEFITDGVNAVEITAEGDYLPYRDHQRLTAEDVLPLETDGTVAD